MVYKICERALWTTAEQTGVFRGAPVDERDGFIHFSTAGQVAETAARHFAGRDDLVLVASMQPGSGRAQVGAVARRRACSRISMARCRSARCNGSGRYRLMPTAGTVSGLIA